MTHTPAGIVAASERLLLLASRLNWQGEAATEFLFEVRKVAAQANALADELRRLSSGAEQ